MMQGVRDEALWPGVPGRSEMICKMEEVRHEMESRLDSQRRHMVQKESLLKSEVEELKVGRPASLPTEGQQMA